MFHTHDFPAHMQREVRLANLGIQAAVYTAHVDFAQLNTIWDAAEWCILFLRAKASPGHVVWYWLKGMIYHEEEA